MGNPRADPRIADLYRREPGRGRRGAESALLDHRERRAERDRGADRVRTSDHDGGRVLRGARDESDPGDRSRLRLRVSPGIFPETLADDVGKPREWWRNRMLRVLLVFIFTTIGSIIGTYVGGYEIVSNLF